jgi:hypothetical protein
MDAQERKTAMEVKARWEAQARRNRLAASQHTAQQAQIKRITALLKDALKRSGVAEPWPRKLMAFRQRIVKSGPLPPSRMRALIYDVR